MGEDPDDKTASFWHAPWKFAVHACVGMLIFAVIAVGAVLLGGALHWLESFKTVSNIIIYGLKFAEFAIFFADLFLFTVFLWRTSKRTLRTL